MLAERLDEQTFHLMMMGFLALGALAAIALVMMDNARALRAGADEPAEVFVDRHTQLVSLWPHQRAVIKDATSHGDVTTIPADQHHQLLRARFERMDGVL